MASKDDDVQKLYTAIKDLEIKLDKLSISELEQRVQKIENYIESLEAGIKYGTEILEKLKKVFFFL
jgi:uncharacterized small protein (DUF1192 family)